MLDIFSANFKTHTQTWVRNISIFYILRVFKKYIEHNLLLLDDLIFIKSINYFLDIFDYLC